MKISCLPAYVIVTAALCSASFLGCGGSEQTESGTQAQVTDEMKREAEASADYIQSQAKAKKSGPKKNIDAREPGQP